MSFQVFDIFQDNNLRFFCVYEPQNLIEKVATVISEAFPQSGYAETLAWEAGAQHLKVGQIGRVNLSYVAGGEEAVVGFVYFSDSFIYVAREYALEFLMFLESLMKRTEAAKKVGIRNGINQENFLP